MLREWSVRGFKSLRETDGIQLRSINVFAGANSSGKSSLLQTILLLKQTLQYGAQNRPLSLNGPILRLGTLDDLLYSGTAKQLEISFKFDLPSRASGAGPWMEPLIRRSWTSSDAGELVEIDTRLAWSPAKPSQAVGQSSTRLQVALDTGSFCVQRSSPDGKSRLVYSAEFRAKGTGVSEDWFDVTLDPLTQAEVFGDKPDAWVSSLYVTHFLPSWVQFRFDAGKQMAKDMAEAMFSRRSSLLGSPTVLREVVPAPALQIVNQWLETVGEKPISPQNVVHVEDVSSRFQPFLLRRLSSPGRVHANLFADSFGDKALALRALQDEVEIAIAGHLNEGGRTWDSDLQTARTLGAGADFIRAYFKSGVRYLGPLRDEPRPVYPLEALENTTDVGYRGEHTAAVLDLNAQTRIEYIPSTSFREDTPDFRSTHTTLKRAVVDWLGYMGVAQDVEAREEGVFGNRLQVTTAGLDKLHDLTNVGVGVSQVLPIVVSSLLAPKSSLLLFEQPELHLHPRVQARLADFFLAIAMSGRQCVLETHSEYLIERFRRRIAESENQRLEDILAIYFAERESGETKFRPVSVSKYGAIEDWPADFFDQSQIEASRILEAAAKKRQKERQGGKN